MSVHAGSNNTDDGLVFQYDSTNTKKSWKGKPTVNLIANAGVDAASVRSTDGSVYGYFSADITAYVLANWSASNNKFSMSFEGKRDFVVGGTGGGGDGFPSMYIYFGDWSWSSSFGTGSYEWSYVKQDNITMPNPAGKTVYFTIYHMNSGNPGRSYSRNHQVEFGTFATPFVNGTRNNTQSIVDLTTNNTISINSLTYNTDGSFSFNGSNDKMTLSSSPFSGMSNFTIEAVVKQTSAGSVDYIVGNYGAGNNGIEFYLFNGKFSTYITSTYVNGVTTLNANQWYHLTTTRSNGIVTMYLNGIFETSGSANGSIPTTNPFTIGNGHDYTSEAFGGNIATLKIYNRSLSSSEVLTNFNSVRSKFGL